MRIPYKDIDNIDAILKKTIDFNYDNTEPNLIVN